MGQVNEKDKTVMWSGFLFGSVFAPNPYKAIARQFAKEHGRYGVMRPWHKK